jgi:hypothetical protein
MMHRSTIARRSAAALLIGATTALGACNADRLTAANRNQPSVQTATTDPNAVQFAITGIVAANRNQLAAYVRDVGIFGRENFNYTQTEGRNTSGFLVNFSDPAGFASGLWAGRYQNLRNIFNLSRVVEQSTALSAEQKSAAQGFLRTYEALELHYVVATRHNLGAVVELREDPLDLAPFVSRDSAYAHVVGRLDQGNTLLGQGGAAFPFALTTGFAGFTTPTTFRQFNRAIYARVQAWRGSLGCGAACYQATLTALAQTWIDPAGDLQRGVYATYSTAAGDATNAANTFGGAQRVIVGHPSILVDAPRKADGTPDNRVAGKVTTLATAQNAPGSGLGIATSVGITRYPTQDAPIPIIKNEELILLRAEARYFTGDVAGALTDLNAIRTRSGGLAAITQEQIAARDQFVTELLVQRRLSLFLEGHRWVDVRRFGRLETLPRDLPNHRVAEQMVIPQGECLVRRNTGNQALFGPGCP